MKNFFLAVFSLMLVSSSNAKTDAKEVGAKPVATNQRALPVIAVSGSEIRINGTTVWLGDTLETWKRVIGGTPTCYDAGMIISCVWHSNGLTVGTDHYDKTRATFMLINLTIEPPDGERAPSWPKSPFRGTLKLDGVPIYPDTAFRDLRRQVPASRELRCGGSDCGNPSAAFSEGANIHMNLARRSENAPLLRFSIACTRTKICTALIPSRT
jgi:hypothetical protein